VLSGFPGGSVLGTLFFFLILLMVCVTQLIIQINFFFPDYLKVYGASKLHLQRDFLRTCYNINFKITLSKITLIFSPGKQLIAKINVFLENYHYCKVNV
jgi:hypothetical protein